MRFKFFRKYRFVLVTGPQRSGTTIAARMISADTGHQFLPEGAMAVQDKQFEAQEALPLLLDKLRLQGDSAVIQCPIQCRYIHEFATQDTIVVMMRRPIDDIIKSEERIGWDPESTVALYTAIIEQYNFGGLPISVVKYFYWDKVQRGQIIKRDGEVYELRYLDLEGHPLWLSQEERQYFHSRQIGHDESYANYEVIL